MKKFLAIVTLVAALIGGGTVIYAKTHA